MCLLSVRLESNLCTADTQTTAQQRVFTARSDANCACDASYNMRESYRTFSVTFLTDFSNFFREERPTRYLYKIRDSRIKF